MLSKFPGKCRKQRLVVGSKRRVGNVQLEARAKGAERV